MLERFVTRERERLLGILFAVALIASVGYGILAEHAPIVARIVACVCGGVFLVLLIRWLVLGRWRKPGPAPVGPLSPDERSKARLKLKPTSTTKRSAH